ncbi:MAG: tetratricopeptide repeat protein [Planctomycetota bacterium]
MKELTTIVICLLLLFAYEKGCKRKPDRQEAIQLGNGYKMFLEHRFQRAIQLVEPLAVAGSSNAQMFMGLMCEEGQGTPQSYQAAKSWYLKSAEQGNCVSQYAIGLLYTRGLAVPKSMEAARKWLELAAKNGHEGARFRLTLMDYNFKNDKELLEYYRNAAEEGTVEAQYLLGQRFKDGKGLYRNDEAARHWLGKAASKGHEKAMQALGWLESKQQPMIARNTETKR